MARQAFQQRLPAAAKLDERLLDIRRPIDWSRI
jgi:hypothetical protein